MEPGTRATATQFYIHPLVVPDSNTCYHTSPSATEKCENPKRAARPATNFLRSNGPCCRSSHHCSAPAADSVSPVGPQQQIPWPQIQDSKVLISHILIQDVQWNVCVTYSFSMLVVEVIVLIIRAAISWRNKDKPEFGLASACAFIVFLLMYLSNAWVYLCVEMEIHNLVLLMFPLRQTTLQLGGMCLSVSQCVCTCMFLWMCALVRVCVCLCVLDGVREF